VNAIADRLRRSTRWPWSAETTSIPETALAVQRAAGTSPRPPANARRSPIPPNASDPRLPSPTDLHPTPPSSSAPPRRSLRPWKQPPPLGPLRPAFKTFPSMSPAPRRRMRTKVRWARPAVACLNTAQPACPISSCSPRAVPRYNPKPTPDRPPSTAPVIGRHATHHLCS